jgi:hypothetical protein
MSSPYLANYSFSLLAILDYLVSLGAVMYLRLAGSGLALSF